MYITLLNAKVSLLVPLPIQSRSQNIKPQRALVNTVMQLWCP